jgi:hypothetical protein
MYRDAVRVCRDAVRMYRDAVRVYRDVVRVYRDVVRTYRDVVRTYRDAVRMYRDDIRTCHQHVPTNDQHWESLLMFSKGMLPNMHKYTIFYSPDSRVITTILSVMKENTTKLNDIFRITRKNGRKIRCMSGCSDGSSISMRCVSLFFRFFLIFYNSRFLEIIP